MGKRCKMMKLIKHISHIYPQNIIECFEKRKVKIMRPQTLIPTILRNYPHLILQEGKEMSWPNNPPYR